MLTIRRYIKTLLMVAMAMVSLSACSNADEEYQPDITPDNGDDNTDGGETVVVDLNFDWLNTINANPSGMCVYFYPTSGDDAVRRFDFSSTAGGRIKIARGKYNIVCYNNDTEAVRFYGIDNFYSHTAYTREGSVYEPIYGNTTTDQAPTIDNQRVTIEPDMMWGCAVKGVEINGEPIDSISEGVIVASGTKAGSDLSLTISPKQLVHEYSYEIRNVGAIGNVAGLSVAISGMASELTFANDALSKECITIPSNATYDGSTIRGTFLSFGIPKMVNSSEQDDSTATVQPATHNYLTLYVVKSDGSKYAYGSGSQRIDVTSQMQDETIDDPSATHETIIVDGIGEARSIDGMTPNVKDWREKNEEIKI